MSDDPRPADHSAVAPEHWLQAYGDELFRYALRRLRDPASAEDAVQETLLAALEACAGYAGRAAEKSWLVGILKHKVIDAIRRRARESPVEDLGAWSEARAPGEVDALFDARGGWIRPPQDWGDPEKVLASSRFLTALEQCLVHLKPALARVFTLRELLGESTEAICKELGVSATNCGVLLYRARMALRRCLEAEWGEAHGEPR